MLTNQRQPTAQGLMIFALVYSFYAVSGGNINPAGNPFFIHSREFVPLNPFLRIHSFSGVEWSGVRGG